MDNNNNTWQKYLQLGQEVQESNQTLWFYLKAYACELMINQHKMLKQKNDPETQNMANLVNQTFKELEVLKSQNYLLKNRDQCKQQIINFISSNLQSVEQQINQYSKNPNIKKSIDNNLAYIDSLQQFGPFTSDIIAIRNQALNILQQLENYKGVQNSDGFNIPDEGEREQCRQSQISMQNNQQYQNNQNQSIYNNNLLHLEQNDAYYQDAFNKLSQSKMNDMDKNSIQRILQISQNMNLPNANSKIQSGQKIQSQFTSKIQSQVASKTEQSQRIKSIYYPQNFDLFNQLDGMPQNNIPQNNDNNFETPNLLKQSNMQKINIQQSFNSQQYNINDENIHQTQDFSNNYIFKSNCSNKNNNNNPQNQSQIQKSLIQQQQDQNFEIPNLNQNQNEFIQQQNNIQLLQNNTQSQLLKSNQSQFNNIYDKQSSYNNQQFYNQPSSFNNMNQPSSYNNKNDKFNNNFVQQPSSFQNPNQKQSSVLQQQSTFQEQCPTNQQQQSALSNQSKLQPQNQQKSGTKPNSIGLIKIQIKKLCEQTINQMKSTQLEQAKANLIQAIKHLDQVQITQ